LVRPLLLDVNALIALFDSAHVHHAAAHAWLADNAARGMRTCPLTENGLLRILSSPGYPNTPTTILDLAQRLEEFKQSLSDYAFWADDFSASQWLSENRHSVASSRLTDAYLLKLAVKKNGALATFDLRIQPSLIRGCDKEAVEHIPL
jgi:uncharacterized protein